MIVIRQKALSVAALMVITAAGSVISRPVVTLSFRDSVTVHDTMIYVRDIAGVSSESPVVAGQVASTPAGESAPPGYSRFIGPDELLIFRLRQIFKDIDFKVNRKARISVQTACVEKKVKEFTGQIREYLQQRCDWKVDQWSVTLLNPETSWKCFDAPLDVQIEGLRNRNPKGEILLQLIAKQGTMTYRIAVICRISATLPVCIAKHELRRGQIINSNELELKSFDISSFGFTPIYSIGDAAGKKASRSIRGGTVINERMLATVPIVSKGDPLMIVMEKGRVRISVSAIARENGNAGQKIWVENEETHRLIRVMVRNKNTVELL